MNELDKELIYELSKNNYRNAKEIAKQKLLDDKAKKDKSFCKNMLDLLEGNMLKELEVPANVRGLVTVGNDESAFENNRYYLSNREQELTEHIICINKAAQKLSELGIRFVNTTLLYGESGTGKTTYAMYLAYKMKVPFVSMKLSQLIDSHLGATQRNLDKVFEFIKDKNCVFMMDEIDYIAKKRGSDNEIGEISRIVISLMQSLDELNNGVILLAATNRLEVIDAAVLRRFSKKHEVIRLSKKERKDMANKFYHGVDGYEISDDEITELSEPDLTQAALMERMILRIVEDLTNQEISESDEEEQLTLELE